MDKIGSSKNIAQYKFASNAKHLKSNTDSIQVGDVSSTLFKFFLSKTVLQWNSIVSLIHHNRNKLDQDGVICDCEAALKKLHSLLQ